MRHTKTKIKRGVRIDKKNSKDISHPAILALGNSDVFCLH
jgi:hypothetical protein